MFEVRESLRRRKRDGMEKKKIPSKKIKKEEGQRSQMVYGISGSTASKFETTRVRRKVQDETEQGLHCRSEEKEMALPQGKA